MEVEKPQLEFHSLILRQVSDAVISIDNQGHVTYLNPSAERQYDVVAAEVVGRPLIEVYRYQWLHDDDEARASAALASGGYWRGENLHVRHDGRVLHVESSVNVLHDDAGAPVGLLAVIRDITAAKRADEELRRREAALRESDERQRMALEAGELGTWRHEIATGRVDLDARACDHYGLGDSQTTVHDVVMRVHPDDRAVLRQTMAAALDPERRAPVHAEYRVVEPGGRVRWLSINGLVHFEDGPAGARPVIGTGTTRDISEHKRSEQALRDADRRKDEFLAILAHELRNPLAPIRTAVAILQTRGLPESLLGRSREIIERQIAHMTRLIDDLLDVSRLSRGQMRLQRGPLHLDQVLDAAIETARPVIEQHRHTLVQQRPARVIALDGDLARLSQAFANLLNNAAKFTPPRGTITLEAQEIDGAVQVRVSDTGQGIAPERLERIFDLFVQGSDDALPTLGGLGIGLALARRLVELHGGSIHAASSGLGHGSTFTVTLPTTPTDAAAADRDVRQEVAGPLRRRVLVVDDSVDAADTTGALLESAGCDVRTVYDGEQALTEITRSQPEIVLLDLGMPGLSGLDVCRRIRALPHGDQPFVVAVTGWGQDEDRRRTREAGFDAHLVKPVAPRLLLELVAQAPAGR